MPGLPARRTVLPAPISVAAHVRTPNANEPLALNMMKTNIRVSTDTDDDFLYSV